MVLRLKLWVSRSLPRTSGDDFQRSVIVAMTVMGVVQAAVHQIANMVSVGDSFVAAPGPVDMALLMTEAVFGNGRTVICIRGGDFDDMLVHVPFMRMVEMAVVQIVHVIAVTHGRMAAPGAMDMRMVLVFRIVASHRFFP